MKHRQGVGVKCTFYSHNTLYIIVTTEHTVVNSAGNRQVSHQLISLWIPTATRIYVSFG
jgi:hypothetical protein